MTFYTLSQSKSNIFAISLSKYLLFKKFSENNVKNETEFTPIIAIFRQKNVLSRNIIPIILLCGLATFLPITRGIYQTSTSYSQFGLIYGIRLNISWYLLSFIAFLTSIFLLVLIMLQSPKYVSIHKKGLIIKGNKVTNILWKDITGISSKTVRHKLLFLNLSTSYLCKIHLKGGSTIRIHPAIRNQPDLISYIKSQIYPAIFKQYQQYVSKNGNIKFGPLTFQNKYIMHQQKIIPWENIESMCIESGNLFVEFIDKKRKLQIPTENIPNIELLLLLINQITIQSAYKDI